MSTTQNPTATDWPDGVIARYLTVGGARVNIHPGSDGSCESVCAGCGARESSSGFTHNVSATPGMRRELAVREAKSWSQGHAEVCCAVPQPEAGPR